MATTTILNDLIDLNQTGNTTALKGCVGTNANQPADPTISVQYLVVGGGGGGGSNGTASGDGLGGGGAGGFSTGTIAIPNNTAVNIIVGEGGLGGGQTSDQSGTNGQDSGFYTIQGQGGGGGGEGSEVGSPGGSGGGGGRNSGNLTNTGVGVSGQGNSGGLGGYGSSYNLSSGGGGGGASTAGAAGGNSQSSAGAGGTGSDAVALGIITQANGITANIGEVNGATLNFSGGGGGGQASAGAANDGGLGGGGNGGTNSVGSVGTANTGGGGGGDGSTTQGGGGTGGSGVVILKYANTATETIAGSLAGGITTGTTGICNYQTTASALYQLNDNANDTCGNSNGTFTNSSYVTGKFGNAANFNGSNNYIEVPLADTPSLLVSTVTFWVKTTTTSADGIIGVGLSSSGYWQSFQAYCYGGGLGGALVVRYGNGTAEGPSISSTSSIDTGNWVFCAVTMSGSAVGSTIKLYVNGILETTHTTTVSRTDSTSKGLVMGAYYAGNTSQFQNWFTGAVDQARIFPSVLTADQVAMLYAENIGATKFTENSGSDTVLVFKAGSGTINLTDSSLSGPKIGDLRTNTDQASEGSISTMEHYTSTGWRILQNVSLNTTMHYLVVGGGGGGGGASDGGGGGGGLRTSWPGGSGGGTASETPISAPPGTTYTITVGTGGNWSQYPYGGIQGVSGMCNYAYGPSNAFCEATAGSDSSIAGTGLTTVVGTGGGGGNQSLYTPANSRTARNGGSGAGGGVTTSQSSYSGGTGQTGEGFAGGSAGGSQLGGGGGGGAGAAGQSAYGTYYAGNGGDGLPVSISGTSVTYAGGGGGSMYPNYSGNRTSGSGGSGGGGNASAACTSIWSCTVAQSGTNYLGGGGGAAGMENNYVNQSGSGGIGVVILRMPTTKYTGSYTGSNVTVTTDGTDTILTFKDSGTYTS